MMESSVSQYRDTVPAHVPQFETAQTMSLLRFPQIFFVSLIMLPFSSEQTALRAEEPASPAAPLMRLIKNPQVPQAQQGRLIELISQRGNADDLTYLFEQAVEANAYSPELRLKTLQWLTESALTRKIQPKGDLKAMAELIRPPKSSPDKGLQLAAIQLAGACRAKSQAQPLAEIAVDEQSSESIRQTALETLVAIDPKLARSTLENLLANENSPAMQYVAVAALVQLDPSAAAPIAANLLNQSGERPDPAVLLNAFLNRKGGPQKLAESLTGKSLNADTAKLALRHMYSIGRSDPSLVAALSAAAGLEATPEPLSPEQVKQLAAEVLTQGDAARGEEIFRRADVSCMKCHAVSKAGGQVGPDLSAVGASSPVDYLINSILQPNLAVKEAYLTRIVYTQAGKVHQGILVNRDDQRIILKESTGKEIRIPTADIDEELEGESLMPQGLTKFLTHRELLDLVRFLSELGKPGDYAIRKTPTIQRWRLLRQLPDNLSGAVVDPDLLREELQGLSEDAWIAVYAKVAGGLPVSELAQHSQSQPLILRADFEVTRGGEVGFKIDAGIPCQAAVDEEPLRAEKQFQVNLTPGKHHLYVFINSVPNNPGDLRVELFQISGSPAEFQVVDGR